MVKTTIGRAAKTASSKPKSTGKAALAVTPEVAAVDEAFRVDDDRIRERAYCLWIAEGQPHGRDLAHWQRARHELLAAQ
jgi:hypothetical protein